MDHLMRSRAPISDEAWAVIDDEARPRLTSQLAARKLVDFAGPEGWEHSAVDLGRVERLADPGEGLSANLRRVQPLVELRAGFTVSRRELDAASRGAPDPDLDDLARAVRLIAWCENVAVFHGLEAGAIKGISQSCSHEPLVMEGTLDRYPTVVAQAVDILRQSGIGGPYGLAIGPAGYTSIIETTEHGGYLLLDHLRKILDGPVVWAPGVEGAMVLSLRGGDFVLNSGEDLSIGYLEHDADSVSLYLEESFTFRVLEPDAAVTLRRATG